MAVAGAHRLAAFIQTGLSSNQIASTPSQKCSSPSVSMGPRSSLLKDITAAASLSSSWLGCSKQLRPQLKAVAKDVQTATPRAGADYDEKDVYTVELVKPFGIKFYKGSDGGVYIDALAPGQSADATGAFSPGDKVLETSAMFGDEMWPAAEYGRTMYTVKQRIGILTMKMLKKYGQREANFVAVNPNYTAERNAGNYGDAIREKQIENYLKKQELKEQRQEELTEGLKLYKKGDYEGAMLRFETLLGLQPESREVGVTNYNVACCYSKLNKIEAGLIALEAAMEAGFEDYKTIRTDPDLANLRASDKFTPVLNKYDEPFINENAMKALKGVFGMFGKK
eukprot:jgi/Mesen1/9552/ME000640S08903